MTRAATSRLPKQIKNSANRFPSEWLPADAKLKVRLSQDRLIYKIILLKAKKTKFYGMVLLMQNIKNAQMKATRVWSYW